MNFWKALSLDYRPKGKRIRTYTTYLLYKTKQKNKNKNKTKKTGVDILNKIENLLQKEV